MTEGFDDLRSTLIKRTQPQQPTQQDTAPTGFGGPTAPKGGYVGGMGRGSASMSGMTSALQQLQPTNPSLLSGLAQAVSGAGGMKMGPKTGMSVPTWLGAPTPMGPGDIPTGMPNNYAKVPPRWERFETAEKMKQGYRDGWNPNPMLIRILEGGN